jgi:hypothetical protein
MYNMKVTINTLRPMVLILILFCCFNRMNYAQDVKKNAVDTLLLRTNKKLPILNGFRFMPSDMVKEPFVNTYFKVGAGTGIALDLTSYVKNFNGTVIDTVSGDLTYVQGGIEFQYAVNDWLAISAGYAGYGRLGNNTYTILTSGVSYTTGYSLGAALRLVNKEKFVLSESAEFSSTKIAMYSIYDYIKNAVQNYGDTTFKNDLLIEGNVYKLFLNTNVAYAPNNWLGFMGNAGFGIGKPFEQKDRGNVRIALAGSVDFLNVKHINFPVGILASIKYNAYSETGENVDNVFTYGFRIAYTGHKDFDVGIENTYSRLNFRQKDEQIKSLQTAARVRYYF